MCSCTAVTRLRLAIAERSCIGLKKVGKPSLPKALSLAQAKTLLHQNNSTQILLEGPGDPLVNQGITAAIFDHLHQEKLNCDVHITTSGIGGVNFCSHYHKPEQINLVIDSWDIATLKKIYSWVRPARKNIALEHGCKLIIDEQKKLVQYCIQNNIALTIKTTLYPENQDEIVPLVKELAERGVGQIQLIRSEGFDENVFVKIQKEVSHHLPIISDLEDISPQEILPPIRGEKPYIAVTTEDGENINQHLGHATKVHIFGQNRGKIDLIETRKAPPKGGGEKRWQTLAKSLQDCALLITQSVGPKPQHTLEDNGLIVIATNGKITSYLQSIYNREG